MTVFIPFSAEEEAQLQEAARREGLDPGDLVRKLVAEYLPSFALKESDDPTLRLFGQWDEEDAQMTPEEFEAKRRLWEEFEIS